MLSIYPENREDVAFLFNVRINHKERFQRLGSIFHYLGPAEIISARIRGQFAQDLMLQEFELFENFELFPGSTFQEWKLDLLEQVSKADCGSFVLLQEDHLPMVTHERLTDIFRQCAMNSVDFMPLSFFPQYFPFAEHIKQIQVPDFENSDLSVWKFNKEVLSQIPTTVGNYPVNLVGYFSKRLLVRILLTERPFFKNYSIESPFDFEQKRHETWYLPIKWAFPRVELFACVDDDHGIPGYSLSSRGISEEAREREVEHHREGFVFGELSFTFSLIKRIFIEICPTQILVFPRNLKYTWESVRGFRKRRNIQRRLLGNF